MNDYYLKDLLTKLTGISNASLAWRTLIFCNSIYPLEAYNVISKCVDEFNRRHNRNRYNYRITNLLLMNISNEDWKAAMHNSKDPELTEIQQFCAPIKDLEFKFSKFQQLVEEGILGCEVSGNKYGAFKILLTLETEPNSTKDALFMKKFNPEDFKEEDK